MRLSRNITSFLRERALTDGLYLSMELYRASLFCPLSIICLLSPWFHLHAQICLGCARKRYIPVCASAQLAQLICCVPFFKQTGPGKCESACIQGACLPFKLSVTLVPPLRMNLQDFKDHRSQPRFGDIKNDRRRHMDMMNPTAPGT